MSGTGDKNKATGTQSPISTNKSKLVKTSKSRSMNIDMW